MELIYNDGNYYYFCMIVIDCGSITRTFLKVFFAVYGIK